jgi:hypothetical protein
METDFDYKEAIKLGIEFHSTDLLKQIYDVLREKFNMNYDQLFDLTYNITGMTETEFDALLYEVDHLTKSN